MGVKRPVIPTTYSDHIQELLLNSWIGNILIPWFFDVGIFISKFFTLEWGPSLKESFLMYETEKNCI